MMRPIGRLHGLNRQFYFMFIAELNDLVEKVKPKHMYSASYLYSYIGHIDIYPIWTIIVTMRNNNGDDYA